MTALTVLAPATVPALHTFLAEGEAPLHFIAGGTDMLVAGRQLPCEGVLVDLSAVQLGFGGVDTIPLSGAASLVASGNAVLTCGGSVDVAATRVRLTATRIDTLIQ